MNLHHQTVFDAHACHFCEHLCAEKFLPSRIRTPGKDPAEEIRRIFSGRTSAAKLRAIRFSSRLSVRGSNEDRRAFCAPPLGEVKNNGIFCSGIEGGAPSTVSAQALLRSGNSISTLMAFDRLYVSRYLTDLLANTLA